MSAVIIDERGNLPFLSVKAHKKKLTKMIVCVFFFIVVYTILCHLLTSTFIGKITKVSIKTKKNKSKTKQQQQQQNRELHDTLMQLQVPVVFRNRITHARG